MTSSTCITAANGHWFSILTGPGGVDPALLDGRPRACPICGEGTDRFTFDDKNGSGSWICRQCPARPGKNAGAGDGMALLQAVSGWEFKRAAEEIERHLGLPLGPAGNGHRPLPRPSAPIRRPATTAALPAVPQGPIELLHHHELPADVVRLAPSDPDNETRELVVLWEKAQKREFRYFVEADYSYSPSQRARRLAPEDGTRKRFLPEHKRGGRWIHGQGPDPWPLYRQEEALAAARAKPGCWVLETEGEKAAEIAREGGLVAISQPGHAHKVEQIQARYRDLVASSVAGVLYLADEDEMGVERAQQALEAAAAVGLQLVVLPASVVWPSVPEGGSIDDAPGTAAERVAALEKLIALIEPGEWAEVWAEWRQKLGLPAPVEQAVAAADVPQIVPDGSTAVQEVVTAPIPVTEAQAFELLRGRARQVLEEHPRKVEQELAMRMAATGLGLPALSQQQIRMLLWEARNGDAGPVQPLTPEQPLSLAPTPWLLEGVVMAGALNLIVALPKIGKTAWVLGFLGAWLHGQQAFLGCGLPATPCPPILIVGTDQPENDWGRMLKQFGLLDHINRLHHRIVGLFTAGRPLHLDAEGIDRIASYAEQHPGLLVLVDSLHACISPLGLKEESAEVAEPVRDLMSSLEAHGATVLMIHHANKGRANDGAVAASRGSTALPAVASQTISLTRLQTGAGGQQGNKERRLIIKTEGRGGMPQELLIERTDAEGWICHGDAAAVMEAQAREKAREKLTDRQQSVLGLLCERARAGETTTPADVVRELGHPRNRALETLEALVQKRLALKTPGQPTPDGGRPSATYSPVPDACAEL
jgi:hypothetical protein